MCICSKKTLGGGTVLDLGIYTIQLCQWVFRDEPISITATGKLNDDGVDEEMSAVLKYANGGIAKIKTSGLKQLQNKANIQGTKASMTVSFIYKINKCFLKCKQFKSYSMIRVN